MMRRALFVTTVAIAACGKGTITIPPDKNPVVPSVPVTSIPGHEDLPQDITVKEGPRLLPAETYMRSYLQLFGGLAPLDAQTALRGTNGLFDTWKDYLAAMGMPDYTLEIARNPQTNSLMIAAFERMGVALCDRAVEKELQADTRPPAAQRTIFAFDLTTAEPTQAEFTERFDVLHRTFLGYPVKLAETDRVARFFKVYGDTVAAHAAKGAPKYSFTPPLAGWATVCYGLVRHPEFHAY
jgi:hypothetical protein